MSPAQISDIHTNLKKKIIIVEDEVIVGMDLQKKLQTLGYEVPEPIRYGEEVKDAVTREHPDLILMDIKLKGEMSGLEAGQLVSESDKIPIIFLTAFSDKATLTDAKKSNSYGFLAKPISFDNLRLSLEIALYKAEMEKELQRSEENYRRIFENSVAGIYQSTSDGRFISVNQAFADIVGYPSPQMVLDNITNIETQYYADSKDRIIFQEVLASQGSVKDFEIKICTRNGSFRWVSNNTLTVRDKSGNIDYYEGMIVDITKRKQAELKLQENEKFLSNIFASVQAGISVLDRDLNIVRTNTWLGNQYAEQMPLIGKKCYRVFQQKDVICPWCPSIKAMETGKIQKAEVPYPEEDNPTGWIELSAYPLLDDAGQMKGVIEYSRDISENKRLEQQLQQKLKMEAVGVMAGGIAHNFNNSLAIILGNIELSQIKQGDEAAVNEYLNNAKTAVFHSRDLVQQILNYSSQGNHTMVALHLETIIEETLKLISATLPSTINLQLVKDPQGNDTTIQGDSSQIQEILINLCNNAIQAMDESGDLTILLAAINLAAEDIPLQYSNRSPGNYIMLRIEDNGSGMDHHTLEKIFDPFYTTKTMDKGTGLGLSTVQGIVEQHGGLINVHSELGQGSIFELYFPAIAGKAASNLLKVEADLPRGTESILLIDDDKMVLELGNNILMSLGYQVSAMIDSTKALKLFAANPNKFELVITDQTMPGLTGKDLITELQKIRPDIRTILITGFSNKITREQAEEQGIGAFLMKPLDLPELAQTIRAVLATRNS